MERKRRRGGGGGEIRGAYEEKRQHIIIIIIITPWQNESVRGGPMGGEEKGDSSRGKKIGADKGYLVKRELRVPRPFR